MVDALGIRNRCIGDPSSSTTGSPIKRNILSEITIEAVSSSRTAAVIRNAIGVPVWKEKVDVSAKEKNSVDVDSDIENVPAVHLNIPKETAAVHKDGRSLQRQEQQQASVVVISRTVVDGYTEKKIECEMARQPASHEQTGVVAAEKEKLLLDSDESCTDNSNDWKLLFAGAAGIYIAYLYYGHVQEDVFRFRAADGARMHGAWFLQVLESTANVLGASIIGGSWWLLGRLVTGGPCQQATSPKTAAATAAPPPPSQLPLQQFFSSGASQVLAKALTSAALAAGISFPVVTLTKSAKMLPVMLGQCCVGGSCFGVRDYAVAMCIVAGTALVSLGRSSSSHTGGAGGPAEAASTTLGLCLILLSLCMDGVTAGLQKRLVRARIVHGEAPPTSRQFLLYTNMSMGATAVLFSLASADWRPAVQLLAENAAMRILVCKLCLTSAVGQSFVFLVVAHFDPLVLTTITTSRKILSVIWSLAAKGHVLNIQGTTGLCMAVVAILVQLQAKVDRQKRRQRQETAEPSTGYL